ncbi:hypothetical protein [Spiroplasma endosymbiont of 'Nebria riversi']|uniref:hypothetical protein n=1 Tax=Spiroplasma endosymbiont of 'Nebria riversi' TaxID=2792084 RepID=UPI001C0547F4|nr:hypothetical protein [Spiroplasma endosymbiont of 'Nebria riversi']
MRKFLSALNLMCVVFISGCSKNISNFKKYDLSFPEISNSYLTIIRNFDSVTGIDISDVKNQLPSDIVVPNSDFEDFEYGFKYYDYNDFSTRIKVRDFYKSNATRVVKDSFPIVSYYEKYFIDKLVDVKITFSNQNYYQNWVITSFYAKML